jgi:DNA-binding transcriptional LysR family regulator
MSVWPGAGELDHFGPLRGFIGDEPSELGGRKRKHGAPPQSVIGSVATEIFRAGGLDYPRATVITLSRELQLGLLATGRFLTISPASVLKFSPKRPQLKILSIDLPLARMPIGIVTLKNRMLSPIAKLFIEHAREVARRRAERK